MLANITQRWGTTGALCNRSCKLIGKMETTPEPDSSGMLLQYLIWPFIIVPWMSSQVVWSQITQTLKSPLSE
jgi:hypothetical protein